MTSAVLRALRGPALVGVIAGVVAGSSPALAGPAVIATRPILDAETGDTTFFVGAISASGRSLKASSLDLVVDGQREDASLATQSLADWATIAAEASQTWRPPLTVGLTYLWIEGTPPGVLDGIQGFFRRVPSRTVVYPTIYGRLRQDRARLTAAEVSRLAEEVPYLEGYRPNLIDAVRLDLQDLVADAATLKILLLVTDGRDFADPKGDGPGDFAALGRDIRKAGITLLVVAFPPPEADAQQAAANLRDLQESSGGFLRTLEQAQELENALESLGQAVADLQRVRFPSPLSWRSFGGSHHLSVNLTTGDGQRLNAEVGALNVDAKRPWWIFGAVGLAAVAAAAFGILMVSRRSGGAARRIPSRREEPVVSEEDEEVLAAAHDLVRRGVSPKRAVAELLRSHPEGASVLAHLPSEATNDLRFPYFRTRLGRMRLQEMKELLAERSSDHERPVLDGALASILADAVTNQTPPEAAADALVGRVSDDDCAAFAGLDLEELAEALRGAASAHPILGTPRARGIAVAVQDALRSGGGGVAVGWLVRAGGPGVRGETLRLPGPSALIGQAPSCALRILVDPQVAEEHAELTLEGGDFAVTPRDGTVTVEGARIERRHVLSDGETIGVGAGLFIFKSARAGNLSSSDPAAREPRPARRPAVPRR